MSTNGKSSSSGSNGHGEDAGGRRPIRVAIVGVGNCASSLIQGRYYYENAADDEFVPGLMHVNLGGYHVRDIEFVAAFSPRPWSYLTGSGVALIGLTTAVLGFDLPVLTWTLLDQAAREIAGQEGEAAM